MPDDTSRRSERVPEREHPMAKRNFEGGESPGLRDPKKPDRPRRAVRQDSGQLGDVSPRDETAR